MALIPTSPTPLFTLEGEPSDPQGCSDRPPANAETTSLFTPDNFETFDRLSASSAVEVYAGYNPIAQLAAMEDEPSQPVSSTSRGAKRAREEEEEYHGRNTGLESPQRPSINPWKKARKN
jgi:hypothetical protein